MSSKRLGHVLGDAGQEISYLPKMPIRREARRDNWTEGEKAGLINEARSTDDIRNRKKLDLTGTHYEREGATELLLGLGL